MAGTVDQTKPEVKSVALADDGMSAKIVIHKLTKGFVYEFDLNQLRSSNNNELLHRHAYYTVNEIPQVKRGQLSP